MRDVFKLSQDAIGAAVFIVLSLLFTGCSSMQNASSIDKTIVSRNTKRLKIGMTSNEVLARWGLPSKVKQKKNYSEFDEIWIYIPHWKFRNYLYFKDGILVGGKPNPEDLISI